MKHLSVVSLFLLFACSENKPVLTENEQNYLNTRDSIIKYKADILELSKKGQGTVTDFIQLDYSEYKAKYHLSEREMDILRRNMNVRCEEVKTFIAIRENRARLVSK